MNIQSFDDRLKVSGSYPLLSTSIKTLQVNVGFRCNQSCAHCHVSASPARVEVMSREVMESCLDILVLKNSAIETVDITGGAPEMHPDYRWFVERLSMLGVNIKTRTNLTILMEDEFQNMPEFFASHRIEVIASLPCYSLESVDSQRGTGVFDASIAALQRLNSIGYGIEGTGRVLNLVYNPAGANLPPKQTALEEEYKDQLLKLYNVSFTNLFTITNMPLGRFARSLSNSKRLSSYMELLAGSYNAVAARSVMCRELLSVGYDGSLFDCDFNQILGLKCAHGAPDHISNYDLNKLAVREIIIGEHCYGCTAGAGSSCGGVVAQI